MGAKQIHDKYGKEVLRRAFGNDFNSSPVPYSFGDGAGKARIDGTVDDCIAIEVESRASKQVRGALVDITLHLHKLKLVVLLPMYGNGYTEPQCRAILNRICPRSSRFEVVTLMGNGNAPKYLEDVAKVRKVVQRLRQK